MGWKKGMKHTKEDLIKMSESQKGSKHHYYGKHLSEEHKKKISDEHKGNILFIEKLKERRHDSRGKFHHSPEAKKKISESKKGKSRSPETIRKMSETVKAKCLKGERNPNWKGGFTKEKKKLKYKLHQIQRRALKAKSIGSFTLGEWDLLKKQYNHTCPQCNEKEPDITLTMDHIIPLSKGGSNWIQNIQPLCVKCNSGKATKIFRIKPNGETMLF